MLTYGFFNAVYTEGIPDRSYTADNLAEFFDSIIGDGVSADIQDSFKVLASSGMQVNLNPGFCWIHGYYAKNSSMYPLVVSAAPPTDTRIDAVVLRWSRSDRNILPQVLTGVASPNPQRPQITRNADTYDLLLGYITLNAGDSAITSNMITDTRADTDVCGIIDTFASRLLPDGSVTEEKLADGSITKPKLSPDLQEELGGSLYFQNVLVLATTGDIATISNAKITADHVVSRYSFANPEYITTRPSWTTVAGSLIINGTCRSATTVDIVLVKKNN